MNISLKKEQQKSDLRKELEQKIKEGKALQGMLYTLVLKPESEESEKIRIMVKRWAEFNKKK